MSELRAQMAEWRAAVQRAAAARAARAEFSRALALVVIVIGIVLPFFFATSQRLHERHDHRRRLRGHGARANIVVGFAGLLDLGYVAFYALGAYSVGWFGSDFFFKAHVHVGVTGDRGRHAAGIHLNFLLILVAAAIICAIAGMIIGLPTLRLRGDYIAIVTLAFGEIIGVVAVNGQSIQPRQRHDPDRRQPRHQRRRPAVLPGHRHVQPARPADPGTG